MKSKWFLMLCLSLTVAALASGCSRYDGINEELDGVTIQNVLPDTTRSDYSRLSETDEAIYEQQLAACRMLSDAYKSTSFTDFVDEDTHLNTNKVIQLCNDKRRSIDNEIATNFILNIYHIISEVKDCPNQDAFIEKAYEDVLNFYDAYDGYVTGTDKNKALCDILTDYAERNNLLALTFLAKNEQKVYNAAVAMIEENAAQSDSEDYTYRYFINENNQIINALNTVFDGVPQPFARRISNAGTLLAQKLMDSLDSISDSEKERLMQQMTPPSPTPEVIEELIVPSILPLPTLPAMTATPVNTPRPTVAPVVTAAPRATQAPAVTQAPVVTKAPVVTPAPAPTQRPTDPPAPTPTPTEDPGYSFSVEEDRRNSENNNNDEDFPSYSFN